MHTLVPKFDTVSLEYTLSCPIICTLRKACISASSPYVPYVLSIVLLFVKFFISRTIIFITLIKKEQGA